MLIIVAWPLSATRAGLIAAVVCGAVTSGLGYAVWYRALRGLEATQGAIVQLSVPVIAALGAVGLLGELLSPRLLVSAVAILGGIALVLTSRGNAPRSRR
jgi:drug/metabolite transporter (DMT)-like permease